MRDRVPPFQTLSKRANKMGQLNGSKRETLRKNFQSASTQDLNSAIHREHYQLPTQQEITSRLAGAKYFSKLDAKSGFWQMPLDEESSYLTTFNTPFGRYRFTVIPFGAVFAQEVFHRTVNEKFKDIAGCKTDVDDILVWG